MPKWMHSHQFMALKRASTIDNPIIEYRPHDSKCLYREPGAQGLVEIEIDDGMPRDGVFDEPTAAVAASRAKREKREASRRAFIESRGFEPNAYQDDEACFIDLENDRVAYRQNERMRADGSTFKPHN